MQRSLAWQGLGFGCLVFFVGLTGLGVDVGPSTVAAEEGTGDQRRATPLPHAESRLLAQRRTVKKKFFGDATEKKSAPPANAPGAEKVAAFEKAINKIQEYSFNYGRLSFSEDLSKRWAEVVPLLATMKSGPINSVNVSFEPTDEQMLVLTQFTEMESFHIWSAKKLTDAGLEGFRGKTKLKSITFGDMSLVTAKGWEVLATIPSLNEVRLSRKKLAGQTAFLAKLTKLGTLDLSGCELTDNDLRPLGKLKLLRSLELSHNPKITDVGLAHLGGVNRLETLSLNETGVTDAGLATLAECEELRELSLATTKVTDAGFKHLAALSSLENLNVSDCKIKDDGFRHLAPCRNLKRLTLSKSPEFTGLGFEHLAKSSLAALDLRETGVNDAGLAKIKALRHVTELTLPKYGDEYRYSDKSFWSDLHPERITDAGLKHVGEMTGLQSLYLSGGGITDAGLSHLKNLKSLRTLNLGACPEVLGTTLKDLSGLSELYSLNLGQTGVTDDQLQPLEKMKSLRSLTLGPEVTPKRIEEYKKAHSEGYVSHQTEYYSAAILSRLRGGPLTADEVAALDGLKRAGAYTENSDSQKSISFYSYSYSTPDKEKLADALKHFKALKNSSVSQVQIGFSPAPDFFRAVCDLKQLEKLTFSDLGQITDADLASLGNCKKLKSLTLQKGPRITAEAMSVLSKLGQLEDIHFEGVALGATGATALQNHKRLKRIVLKKCGMTDDDLPPLAKVSTLESLDVTDNDKITGSGFANFSNSEKLQSLELSGTGCTDSSLAPVGKMSHLRSLNLTRTKVTDEGLAHLTSASSLSSISLPETFRGKGFVHLGKLKELYSIELPNNPLVTGKGVQHLADSNISHLQLKRTGITDAGMRDIAKLKKLRYLYLPDYGMDSTSEDGKATLWTDLQAERLTDEGLKHLADIPELDNLYVSGGGVTDKGVEQLASLKKLSGLSFGACPQVTGSGFAKLTDLPIRNLDIGNTAAGTDSVKHLDKIKLLRSVTFGPSVSAKAVAEFKKNHSDGYISHNTEYSSPALKARTQGRPLTKDELAALEELKKTGISYYNYGETKSISWYRMDEKELPEIRKLFARLKGASINNISVSTELASEEWQWICGLPNLKNLRLESLAGISDTDFAGLGKSVQLTKLEMKGGEKLSPTAFACLAKLGKLTELKFENVPCGVQGIAGISQIEQLQQLTLNGCSLTDADLKPLSSATAITMLNLSRNPKVTGEFLKGFAKNETLSQLDLSETGCTDAGIAGVSALQGLTNLNLQKTQVTDAGLVHLKGLSKLRYLLLPQKGIKGPGMEHLAGLTDLWTLEIQQCPEFTGEGLEHLSGTSITSLDLRRTGITDAGLAKIAELTKLTRLQLPSYADNDADGDNAFWADAHADRLTDKGLEQLSKLEKLETLYLSGGGITDAGLKHLKSLKKLETLEIDYCSGVNGSGLEVIKELPELKNLNLTHTAVTNANLRHLAGVKISSLQLPMTVNNAALPHLKKIVGLERVEHMNTFSRATVNELKKVFPNLQIEYSK